MDQAPNQSLHHTLTPPKHKLKKKHLVMIIGGAILAVIVVLVAVSLIFQQPVYKLLAPLWLPDYGKTKTPVTTALTYKNVQYGFSFTLPDSWKGFTATVSTWQGMTAGPKGDEVSEQGPQINLRHPLWTEAKPRQDIPIMILALSQWNALQQDKFHIGAAPIGPTELGRNSQYVFALPARYNFAFPVGYEEVDSIIKGNPLHGF
jgi:hypothetical protein